MIDSAGGETQLNAEFHEHKCKQQRVVGKSIFWMVQRRSQQRRLFLIMANQLLQTAKLSFNYTTGGLPAIPVQLDFSSDVTSFASGSLSTLAFGSAGWLCTWNSDWNYVRYSRHDGLAY